MVVGRKIATRRRSRRIIPAASTFATDSLLIIRLRHVICVSRAHPSVFTSLPATSRRTRPRTMMLLRSSSYDDLVVVDGRRRCRHGDGVSRRSFSISGRGRWMELFRSFGTGGLRRVVVVAGTAAMSTGSAVRGSVAVEDDDGGASRMAGTQVRSRQFGTRRTAGGFPR